MAVEFLVLDSKVCKKYVIFGQSSKFEWPNLISNLEGTSEQQRKKRQPWIFFLFSFLCTFEGRRKIWKSGGANSDVVA